MCGTLNSLLGDWLNHALYLYLCACHERTLATCQATGGWVWISSWLPRPLHPLRSSVSVSRGRHWHYELLGVRTNMSP